MSELIKVGNDMPREVSPLNHELYTNAARILEEGVSGGWHIGWAGVGDLIDWIEANYTITKKEEEIDEHLGCMNWPNCDEAGCGHHNSGG